MDDEDFLGYIAHIGLETEAQKKATLRANAEAASRQALAGARKKAGWR